MIVKAPPGLSESHMRDLIDKARGLTIMGPHDIAPFFLTPRCVSAGIPF